MPVPNNTVRTREFTFTFNPKTNPTTGSKEKAMDKIPAALQHKIDYIKALDIPVEQKSRRIGREVLDYWANYWSSSRGDYNLSIEDLLPLIAAAKEAKAKGKGSWSMDEYEAIKKESNLHVSGIAPERMITGKALKEIMVDIVNEKAVMINKVNLGYSVDMSGLPSTSGGKGGLGPDADSLGAVLGSEPAKIMEPAPVDYNAIYFTCCVAATFALSGAVGLILGVTFGGSL